VTQFRVRPVAVALSTTVNDIIKFFWFVYDVTLARNDRPVYIGDILIEDILKVSQMGLHPRRRLVYDYFAVAV